MSSVFRRAGGTRFARQVALHRIARERPVGHGIEWRAVGQLLRTLEERREELALIGRRAEREAGMPRDEVAPGLADLPPERLGAFAVAARGGVIEVSEPFVAVEPDLLREDGVGVARMTALVEHDLQILLLLHPAGRRDRVAVRPDEDVVGSSQSRNGTLVLLDYTLFVWHVLTHEVPFLWRFHEVHHADRDLSTSTALRFHFAEMILSVPWRAAQIVLIGAAPLSLSAWQTTTLVAILFHHANVRLPIAVERRLCRLIMTPRRHGIHHSMVEDEANANWSAIFSWPDYLHRTARFDVPQEAIAIGDPTPDVPPTALVP